MLELLNQTVLFIVQDLVRVSQVVETVRASTGEQWGFWLLLLALFLASLWILKVLGWGRFFRSLKNVLIIGMLYYVGRSALVVWSEPIAASTLIEKLAFVMAGLGVVGLYLFIKLRRRGVVGEVASRTAKARKDVDAASAALLENLQRIDKK